MKGMKRATDNIGKVGLVLLGGILFPILIWVALAVAAGQKLKVRKPARSTAPTVEELLEEAGLSSLNGATKVRS